MTRLISLTMLLISSLASAQTATTVTCLSGGEKPREVFKGTLVGSEITDRPDGSFTVVGRSVQLHSLLDQAQVNCRSWYLAMISMTQDGYHTYRYEKRTRDWNVIKISQQQAVTRLSCGTGSQIVEFDSVSAYVNDLSLRWVESTPPKSGGFENSAGYVDGLNTVTSIDCLRNELE